MVGELKQKGLAAYLVEPAAGDPDAPYRVRIGGYATRAEAEKAASDVREATGGKPWVTREP